MERIQSGEFTFSGPEWEGVSMGAKDIIEGCPAFTIILHVLHTVISIVAFTITCTLHAISMRTVSGNLYSGLLTVDAKSRLTLSQLASHPWLTPHSGPSTPLLTSCVLGREKGTACAIKHTFHAFHQATRAGFTLGDVSRAPLAKRRKHKRDYSPNPAASANSHLSRPSKLDLHTDMRTDSPNIT